MAARESDAAEYLDAVREAGAEPVRFDSSSAGARDLLGGFGGVCVTGGVDVGPERYGAAPSPLIEETDPERDAFELPLIHDARERGLPTLCICRGLQIANVAFGGTLIADIPHALGDDSRVRHQAIGANGRAERGLITEHVVRIEPGSTLAGIIGAAEIVTGARHHQAVERCAADLRVVARTADGIVEALEARFSSPFWLAVQWHPESTVALDDGASRAIFRAFADSAGG